MVLSASEWPYIVLESIFSYLDLASLRSASLVCKSWYRILNDENNDVWRLHCVRRLAQEALQSSELLSTLPTYKSKLRAFCHAWNPEDCSKNIYIKSNGFTLHRNPVAQSTDGARYVNVQHSGSEVEKMSKFFTFISGGKLALEAGDMPGKSFGKDL